MSSQSSNSAAVLEAFLALGSQQKLKSCGLPVTSETLTWWDGLSKSEQREVFDASYTQRGYVPTFTEVGPFKEPPAQSVLRVRDLLGK